MNRFLSLFVVCLVTGAATTQCNPQPQPRLEEPFTHILKEATAPSPGEHIRIATWNIEWFPAGQRKSAKGFVDRQAEAVCGILDDVKPDILVTQETRNLGALILLNKRLATPGLFSHLATSWYYDENEERRLHNKIQQQTGILSRFPWTEIWERDFAPLPVHHRPARGWMAARFTIGGLDFTIYNGHLKSNYGAADPAERLENFAKRLAAVHELKRDLDRAGLDPARDRIIVAGDFNSDLFSPRFTDEETFKALHALGFQHTYGTRAREEIVTLPNRLGEFFDDATMDYIWMSAGWGDALPEAKVVARGASKRKDVFGGDEPGLASDHYLVYIDVPLR
jgi:endonuclease/exonuclease/phosphatase family metal-dependent hydrolase